MKYFIIKDSLNQKIVGHDYPQVHKFIKGYNEEGEHSLYSLYEYEESFPDYVPDLDGFMLAGYAKLTDFVSSSFSSNILIISPNARSLMSQFHLCSHRFYPLGLYKRGIKHDYFLFLYLSDYSDFVDYNQTTFMEYYTKIQMEPRPIRIISKNDFISKRELLNNKDGFSHTIRADKIVMAESFNKDLDFFSISWVDGKTYVSERLKNAIEDSGLTGWEFTPATKLIAR
jgi:hypothetical protein